MPVHLKAAQAFGLNPSLKPRIVFGVVSDTLATEDALECGHLHSATGNRRERYLHGVCRV